jgi:hypothetical protein
MTNIRSGFAACTQSNKPFDIDFYATVNKLKTDPAHQEFLTKLAKLDKPARDKLKISKLLAISPSGHMKNGGGTDHIDYYIPEIYLDSDGYASKDEAIAALYRGNDFFGKHLVYSCLSVSCLGVHFIVAVDKLENEADYLYGWNNLNDQVAAVGIKLDINTRKVAGKMIPACHAEYTYLNPDAEPMVFPEQPNAKIQAKKECHLDAKPDKFILLIDDILSKVEAKGLNFTSGQSHNYILKVATRTNKAGIPLDIVIDVLERKLMISKYPDHLAAIKDCYERYSDQFGQYQRKSKTKNEDKISIVEKAIQSLNANYNFRYNEVLGKPEFQKIGEEKWLPLTNYRQNSIWKDMHKESIIISGNNLSDLLNSDHSFEYDPFKIRLDALPAWDEIDRLDKLAESIDPIYPDKDKVAMYLKKWIVSYVACMYDAIPNHQVLTLMGEQGIGKTKWLQRFILSGLEDYFYSGAVDPNDKDAKIRVAETNFIVLDELETTTRYNLPMLKGLITCQYINERRPYDRRPGMLRRRASFAATVNQAEFLKDQTGSRRFFVIEAKSLDYKHELDMDMVFAQAFHMYKTGFKHWLDKTEGDELTATNNRFQIGEPAEEFVLKCYRLPAEGETGKRLSVTQIAETLKKKGYLREVDNKSVQIVGSTLVKLGFRKTVSKGKGYYWLVEIEDEEQGENVPAIETYPPNSTTGTSSFDDFMMEDLTA